MITRILLVDDDEEDRELFSEAISEVDLCCKLFCAENGWAALEKLNTGECNDIQLILLDINMPRMNGWEMLKELKNGVLFCHIPVVMFSTSFKQDDFARACELGAVAFISKPPNFIRMKDIARSIVSLSSDKIDAMLKKYSTLQFESTSVWISK